MPDVKDPTVSNAFDFFVRGEEILSGGQRVHQAKDLEARMHDVGIEPDDMGEYVDSFRWAMPPHAGGGIGLERLVFLYLNLGNIRHASLFPRDPRTFPNNPPLQSGHLPKSGNRLKTLKDGVEGWNEPESMSLDPMYNKDKHQSIPALISKFGDSTTTAWTDAAYEIWREEESGYAIGFVSGKGHAVTWGDPLCDQKDLERVLRAYLKWLHEERGLSPIWLNASHKLEHFLAASLDWRALSVVSEQVINLDDIHRVAGEDDKAVKRKVNKLERDGVKAVWLEDRMDEALRKEIDAGIDEWRKGRKGAQVHTTEIRPWADAKYRTYLVAKDKSDKVSVPLRPGFYPAES